MLYVPKRVCLFTTEQIWHQVTLQLRKPEHRHELSLVYQVLVEVQVSSEVQFLGIYPLLDYLHFLIYFIKFRGMYCTFIFIYFTHSDTKNNQQIKYDVLLKVKKDETLFRNGPFCTKSTFTSGTLSIF